jgi:nicotinamidase-related amidase
VKNFNGVEVYETLPEIIAPKHTCLVVWDVQNGLVEGCFNRDVFLKNIQTLIEGVRGKLPIVYTLITPLPKTFQSSWGLYSMLRRFKVDDLEKIPVFMAPNSKEREIPEVVGSKPGDIVLEKATPNIFLGTNFESMMRNRGIQTLIFSGIATEIGVETSARDAGARGFYPVIATDCVSSRDQEAHERSLLNMTRSFIMADSSEILRNVV